MSRKLLILVVLGAISLIAVFLYMQTTKTKNNRSRDKIQVINSVLPSEFDNQSKPITADMFK